ncbi:hypothetical protein [Agarivorans gilvus]|uniref:DNA gyrase subunit B n=1 Tax=Agarivorans gilvus TaxID=680279 RepID=A0ABQ1I3H2_9ALTE|nr:hypothetical protein [Agarivorans gilvus]GGB07976.1 hypothetical protein GCM10007414_21700 [Agarivorans gilvus]
MSGIVKVMVMAALAAYPFLIYFGLSSFSSYVIGAFIAAIFAVRLLLTCRGRGLMKQQKWLAVAGLGLAGLALIRQEPSWFKCYPLLVNSLLFIVFSMSLREPQPIIERFARLGRKAIPDAARPYFIKLTKIWCVFFVLNAAVSAWTIWGADLKTWTLYNGLISYLLMAGLLGGEWIYRKITRLEANYE